MYEQTNNKTHKTKENDTNINTDSKGGGGVRGADSKGGGGGCGALTARVEGVCEEVALL